MAKEADRPGPHWDVSRITAGAWEGRHPRRSPGDRLPPSRTTLFGIDTWGSPRFPPDVGARPSGRGTEPRVGADGKSERRPGRGRRGPHTRQYPTRKGGDCRLVLTGRARQHRPYLRRGETVIPCTARTEAPSFTPWADLNGHAVAGNGRRLQARLARATPHKAWQRVKNLPKLLVRATSNTLLARRRVTQDNQGTHTAGSDGGVYDTPAARWRVLHEGLSRQGSKPNPVSRGSRPQDPGPHSPLGLPPGQDRVRPAIVPAALEPAWEARFEANSEGLSPGRGTMEAREAMPTTTNRPAGRPWRLDAESSGGFDQRDHGPWLATRPVFPTPWRQWLQAGVVDAGGCAPPDTGTPPGGGSTPPTKLPTFFFGVTSARVRIDPTHKIPRCPGPLPPA